MKFTHIMVITLLMPIGFCSCEKEKMKTSSTEAIKTPPSSSKEDGDDDDDPIIQGLVIDDGQTADSILTSIIPTHSQTPVGSTNSNGFEFEVPIGSYYFEISENGGTPVTTGDYQVDEDMTITIYLDSL